MARILRVLFLTFIVLSSGTAAADGFLSMIEDLPLPPNLVEDVDAAMVFESAEGRIASAEASGPVSVSEVKAFYRAVLPQLGWNELSDGTYSRAGDRLTLDVMPNGTQGASVRYEIGPNRP